MNTREGVELGRHFKHMAALTVVLLRSFSPDRQEDRQAYGQTDRQTHRHTDGLTSAACEQCEKS